MMQNTNAVIFVLLGSIILACGNATEGRKLRMGYSHSRDFEKDAIERHGRELVFVRKIPLAGHSIVKEEEPTASPLSPVPDGAMIVGDLAPKNLRLTQTFQIHHYEDGSEGGENPTAAPGVTNPTSSPTSTPTLVTAETTAPPTSQPITSSPMSPPTLNPTEERATPGPVTAETPSPTTPAPTIESTEAAVDTPAPTTSTPTTSIPTTSIPTTGTPTTGAPTTGAPTTGAPTTGAPTASSAETGAPTTGAPTASSAETSSPTTSSPASVDTPAPTARPTPDTATAPEPTATPTTSSPTTSPDGETAGNGDLLERVSRFALQGGVELTSDSTYQAVAMSYLQNGLTRVVTDDELRNYYALACIFIATNAIPNIVTQTEGLPVVPWTAADNWLTDSDFCTWFGVNCTSPTLGDVGLVVALDLVNNTLLGSFPPECQLLAGSLEALYLNDNIFWNEGDAGNEFLGNLGDNLRFLYIGNTGFAYPGIPTHISRLVGLEEFDCHFTFYSGPLVGEAFTGLDNLVFLNIEANNFAATPLPRELYTLPNLQFVYAGFSNITGDLSFIESMPQPHTLWLTGNFFNGSSIPPAIFTESIVDLDFNFLGLVGSIPTEIGLATNLLAFSAQDNALTGAIPTELANCVNLRSFFVEKNMFNGEMPAEVCTLWETNLDFAIGADCAEFDSGVCACCDCCEISCTATETPPPTAAP